MDEETAKHMGLVDYRLPENLSTLINKKSATYNLTWMQPNKEQLNTIKEYVENGTIKPIVDKVYPFENSIEACLYLATGRAKGKVIVSL